MVFIATTHAYEAGLHNKLIRERHLLPDIRTSKANVMEKINFFKIKFQNYFRILLILRHLQHYYNNAIKSKMVYPNATVISEPPFSLKTSQICGTFLLLISLFGLVIYMLFIIVVFHRPKFKDKTYFIIAGWLGIADCICLLLMIGYATPCLLHRKSLSDSLALGGILNIGWFSGLPLLIFLAGDRYLCICNKDVYAKFYTKKMTRLYCFACWVFGIGYSLPSFMPCCSLFFDYSLMSWGWNIGLQGAKALALGEITMVVLITSLTYFLNGLVFK